MLEAILATPGTLYGVLGLVIGLTIGFLLLRLLLLSPLSAFPGPLAARLSSYWLVRQCRLTRRSETVLAEHRNHNSDFIRIAPNHISINNPAAVFEIYGHRTGFLKSEFYDAFHQVEPVVFNTRDSTIHQKKRKYMNPAFSTRALAEFEPHMDNDLRRWKDKLLDMTAACNSAEVDLTVWSNYLAFDVIGSFAFGSPFGFIEKGEDTWGLIETIDRRGEVLNALGCVPTWIRPLMRYYIFDRFWSDGLRATANLGKIGQAAYLRRKAESEPRNDLLSYLFAAEDAETQTPLAESEVVAESISFIVGGSDTTSSTIANVFDFISRDQNLQNNLMSEVDTIFPGRMDDTWVPSSNDLDRMPFLVAVLREVMRIRPTSSTGLERVTPQGGMVIAGTYIPGGTIVSVPTAGVMMDDRIFDRPHEFRPERWLDSSSSKFLGYFLPFSTGPRACIGRNFAWMEILKALVVVLKLFRIERATKAKTVIREGFFTKAQECKVVMSRR